MLDQPQVDRRSFLEAVGLALPSWRDLMGGNAVPWWSEWPDVVSLAGSGWPSPEGRWRAQFPALRQRVNGYPLTYLDTAATAQRPETVTRAIVDFYQRDNANPGGTLHALARRAHLDYENARADAARLINAADPMEIVFTRGTTEGLNLVATAWGAANLRRGDEVLLTVAEHSSSMLPWQLAAERAGAVVRYLGADDNGRLQPDDLDRLLTGRTKVFVFTHVSNVLGAINPADTLCARARAAGAVVVVDAAQSVPHFKVDVQAMGCDFLAFSGHKLMGPMGIGVLWGRRPLLEAMPPYQAGSNMAHEVNLESRTYSGGALKFGAGTPNVAGAVGLAAAIRFLSDIGYDALGKHEAVLIRNMLARLGSIPGLRLLGPTGPEERIALFSFVMKGLTPQEISTRLDGRGIAIRSGDLASLPLLERLGVTRAARASLYLYSTTGEIDRLADALESLAG